MENKTIATQSSVQEYMDGIESSQRSEDSDALPAWMKEIISLPPVI
jgi:hypothetical protein